MVIFNLMRLGLLRVFGVWLYMQTVFCLSLPFLPQIIEPTGCRQGPDKCGPIVVEISERALVFLFRRQSVHRPVSIQQLLYYNTVGVCCMS